MSSTTFYRAVVAAVAGVLFVSAFPYLGAISISSVFGMKLIAAILYGGTMIAALSTWGKRGLLTGVCGTYLFTLLAATCGALFNLYLILSWAALLAANMIALLVCIVVLTVL